MEVRLTLRIGNGGKLHRGIAPKTVQNEGLPWERKGYSRVMFVCSCPNCANRTALQRATEGGRRRGAGELQQ